MSTDDIPSRTREETEGLHEMIFTMINELKVLIGGMMRIAMNLELPEKNIN